MTAYELYQQAHLAEAIEAALQQVKSAPTDADARLLLCDLLCCGHELERADRQLDVLTKQNSELTVGLGLYRQLIRAETTRTEFYESGRPPEFMEDVSDGLRLHLRASIALREGAVADASEALQQAEAMRPRLSGRCDDLAFDDFRDLDDLTASFLEVLTSTGKYYWLGWERIESLEFQPPRQVRDLLWRPTQMIIRGGPEAVVYVPVLYAGSYRSADPGIRVGQKTDWVIEVEGPTTGAGQRTFLAGSEDRSILSIQKLSFSPPEAPASQG